MRGILLDQVVKTFEETDLNKKAALPVMVEARPCGVKATGQLWKGQDQNLVGHWTVAGQYYGRWSAPHQVRC